MFDLQKLSVCSEKYDSMTQDELQNTAVVLIMCLIVRKFSLRVSFSPRSADDRVGHQREPPPRVQPTEVAASQSSSTQGVLRIGFRASLSARKLLSASRILIPYSVNNHSEHIVLTLLVRVCVFVQGVRLCLCVCSWVLVCHITTGTHIRTHFMHRRS